MSDRQNKSSDFYAIVEAPYDGHWVLELVDPTYAHELTGAIRFGRPLPPFVPPLRLVVAHAGTAMDFSFTAMGLMVVSTRAEQLLRRVAGSDFQFIPAALNGSELAFSVANVVSRLDCVDHARSGVVPVPGPGGGTLDVPEYHVDAARVGDHQVFRLMDDELVHVMTRRLKDAIEDAGLIGPPLMRMDGTGAMITPGLHPDRE